ncbi:MAG: glutathione synthase [Gammaproteobacteria bacterium]|nr:glutathione synthase [Gammaproteobacteria bacterium]
MIKLGVVMDPIETITIQKDSTFAMLLEAQTRSWPIFYMELDDLIVRDGQSFASMQALHVTDHPDQWFQKGEKETRALSDLDVILMRKDPPFNMAYIYATYILELAEQSGTLVVNKSQSLRDTNEKLATAWFPQCAPPTLVTSNADRIKAFIQQYHDVILKPLDGMGGASIFRVTQGDLNTNVIIESLTQYQHKTVMVQQYIPEIVKGDKRILLINGDPIPYALARIPPKGDNRGNLAIGGTGKGVELTDRDRWICKEVSPLLKNKGLLFVGLDIIGNYLTEINVTSPTCIRELDNIYNLNISAQVMDAIEGIVNH